MKLPISHAGEKVTAPLLNSGRGQLKNNKIKLMHQMEKLRSEMVLTSCHINLIYGDKNSNADELMGASNIVQSWIIALREEI